MNNTCHDSLIDALTQFEQSMAQLYVIFGRLFPSESCRWADLAAEECRQAQWLANFKIYLRNEIICQSETDIVIRRVNLTLEFIENQIRRAASNNIDLREAILVALVIEDSAFESSFLLTFNFKTPKVRKIRRKLIEATGIQKDKLVMWLDHIEGRMKMVA
ncbi:MAG TPA: hypothetical protein ENO07_07070 [candidate division Zixibacteria bacterium]|nr:hypothetical protein [candidate division Zixibacteria bacterium]